MEGTVQPVPNARQAGLRGTRSAWPGSSAGADCSHADQSGSLGDDMLDMLRRRDPVLSSKPKTLRAGQEVRGGRGFGIKGNDSLCPSQGLVARARDSASELSSFPVLSSLLQPPAPKAFIPSGPLPAACFPFDCLKYIPFNIYVSFHSKKINKYASDDKILNSFKCKDNTFFL